MITYRLDISYDGSEFHGYARQEGLRTVQGVLESSLKILLSEEVITAVAGRTDAGVHARRQVVSFQSSEILDTERFRRSMDSLCGPEIAIRAVSDAPEGFHARFSALSRRYRYRIQNSQTSEPLRRHDTWHVPRRLNLELMAEVAEHFVGEKDFSSFCRSIPGRSNVRRVETARWERSDAVLLFWVEANSFCHQMVRSLVGLCYDVGRSHIGVEQVGGIIAAGSRAGVATVAPPQGLVLWEVSY